MIGFLYPTWNRQFGAGVACRDDIVNGFPSFSRKLFLQTLDHVRQHTCYTHACFLASVNKQFARTSRITSLQMKAHLRALLPRKRKKISYGVCILMVCHIDVCVLLHLLCATIGSSDETNELHPTNTDTEKRAVPLMRPPILFTRADR